MKGFEMKLHPIDVAIIVIYVATSVLLGYWVSRRASRDTKAYFLGGNTLPWYFLGVSNASGMFDIAGTMWLVGLMFIYGSYRRTRRPRRPPARPCLGCPPAVCIAFPTRRRAR